ncbi:acyl-[acyl-carrier-protein] thioesterase [Blautia glucerasea]|jgi:medium-chain acyl-[acyl-carrier-protein] hydrolase|uniref:acyl-[acyl-carrier-protein] thioesterase n=1 Tax=Blautia glucerasea TaxID=536633 RepID=UPI001D003752|nr:acyl-ACP thioesterase domain-containing protein [Blautia glucerasea]MCB5389010.1 acyl-[acyl-carrier-protein] thioesterase [Blautia glucerasea]MCB5422217.1 acyl-[acyl-carrier-protein] thioesterase [Blautia luti]
MSYSFKGRVRYSEIGENGCLTLPGIQDYYQDCCTFQSEEIGQGMEVLEARQRAWVLSAWQIVVNRYPKMGETIVATTAPYGFKGFLGMRNFTLTTEAGGLLSYANSIWTNIDTKTGLPARLTDEDTRGYVLDEKLDMDYAPRKIALPVGMRAEEPFAIQKHHLDTHHHVNNCQYIRMAADYLPERFVICQMRAEYKKQALLGDVFYPAVKQEEGKVTVALSTESGEPYAIVEFTAACRLQK